MGSFIFEQDQFSCTRDSVQVNTTPSAAPHQRSAAPAKGASEDTLRWQRDHAELLRQVPPNYAHANPMQYLQSDQHGFDAHRAKIFQIIFYLEFFRTKFSNSTGPSPPPLPTVPFSTCVGSGGRVAQPSGV